MKNLNIFAICLIACSLIYSCSESREEEMVQEVTNNELFSIKPDNEHVQLMYDYLKNTPDQQELLNDNVLGMPYWDREIKYTSNGKPMYVIPLADEQRKEVNAILLLCAETEILKYRLYINDEDLYPKKDFDWIFELFMQDLFQINEKYVFLKNQEMEENTDSRTKMSITVCMPVRAKCGDSGWFWSENCVNELLPDNMFDSPAESDGGDPFDGIISNPLGGNTNPNPNPNPLPKVIPTPEFNKTKAACIYDKIKNETSVLKDLLKDFMPTTSTFNLHFDVGYIPMDMSTGSPRTVYGKTYGTRSSKNPENDGINHKSIYIKINKDFVNNSNLLICNTILHEIIHAEIYKTQEEATKDNGKVNPKILKESYPGLIETYMEINNFSEAQHIYMINQMHNKMVSILKWFDKNNHSQEEYEALAWLGLSKNKVFKSKFNTQQIERIKQLQKKLIDEKDTCD